VKFTVNAYRDREFEGVVQQVRNQPTRIGDVVTYTVVIEVSNRSLLLRPGMPADLSIEIKRVVREPGYRTKMAVISQDPKIDCIGACVGVRGSRIKAVIDELRGERIDIIRWSDSLETLIMNGLKPATIHLDNIYPDVDSRTAVVIVDEDQQSLAIGKKGQNVRLASRLCGWDIDIKTRADFESEGLSGEAGEGAQGPITDDSLEDAARTSAADERSKGGAAG
jgi:transcription antitermination factor NusA-like protein